MLDELEVTDTQNQDIPDGAATPAEKSDAPATIAKKVDDGEAKRIREAAERAATNAILKKLGITSVDDIGRVADAYRGSLSEGERLQGEVGAALEANAVLTEQLKERDFMISALALSTGTNLDDMLTVIKMAKGLVDDESDIQTAVKTVLEMVNKKTPEKPPMPAGAPLFQPDKAKHHAHNPFDRKDPNFNLTEAGRLLREDPAKWSPVAKSYGWTL